MMILMAINDISQCRPHTENSDQPDDGDVNDGDEDEVVDVDDDIDVTHCVSCNISCNKSSPPQCLLQYILKLTFLTTIYLVIYLSHHNISCNKFSHHSVSCNIFPVVVLSPLHSNIHLPMMPMLPTMLILM